MAARSSRRTSGRSAATRKRAAAPSAESGGLRPDPERFRGPACVQCGSPRMTTISMTLTDGSPVSLRSCQVCEHRSWTSPDGDLLLPGVLTRAQKQA